MKRMPDGPSGSTTPAYHYSVQRPLLEFWSQYGVSGRRILLIFGLGFDPRCVPALRVMSEAAAGAASFTTFCARFTNLHDRYLSVNSQYTKECLEQIRYLTRGLSAEKFTHFEVEVNLFSLDGAQIGHELLIEEFTNCVGSQLDDFTDVIVDISAFPRAMMYSLLAHLWVLRKAAQNLFAVVTHVEHSVSIKELGHLEPSYMQGERRVERTGRQLWIPVMGGEIGRYERIFDFLQPAEVYPILSFPDSNPRLGDDILLASRKLFIEKWEVPTANIMYASGEVPLDVFRKISDFVEGHAALAASAAVVVSALSGRTLSLGVLMAALRYRLYLCHSQPTTYHIRRVDRDLLKRDCLRVMPTLIWLDGELYEDRASNEGGR